MTQRTDAPLGNQIEVSLFGPGSGECIAVHLGGGDWMVVDSCLNETGRAVALDYLDSLSVDVGRQVKLIVVTHWHDDHIRGVGRLFRYASNAEFACSAAIASRELATLISAGDRLKFVEFTSGVSELADVMELLNERNAGRYAVGPHRLASADQLLYRSPQTAVEVHALKSGAIPESCG